MNKLFVLILVPLAFFIVSLITLKDYGISWDEPIHFYRGHAYLRYFLTGEKDFQDLISVKERSYYQNDSLNAEYFLREDGGHPPMNGILSALSNIIFFQKLGILGDIDAHHLFNIATATIAVFVVTHLTWSTFGAFPALVAGLTLATYPSFFSEAHFNIKDPPEAAFFALTIWTFWMSLNKQSWKWLLASVVSFSLALGTKFNALFIPVVILPYVLVRYLSYLKFGVNKIFKSALKIPKGYLVVLFLSPFIVLLIFFGTWPYLWDDPKNVLEIFGYYKQIGERPAQQIGYFLPGGINLYPVFWILITTPPIVLVLGFIGLLFALLHRSPSKVEILILLWFLIPIARVTIPGTAIYGGARHIMELLPALAILTGLGAKKVIDLLPKISKKTSPNIVMALIIFGFVSHIFVMVKLHPNQNVYFNSMVGGLDGAKEKNIPYWGNSFGNAYWQAIEWLNKNAENEARLALIEGTGLNIPAITLRSDIKFSNNYWSGPERKGEYLLELIYNDRFVPYPYAWEYIETLLEPVYEVKVDGVAIAALWKNDTPHTKSQFQGDEIVYKGKVDVLVSNNDIQIKLENPEILTRLMVEHSSSEGCKSPHATIFTKNNKGEYIQEPESIPLPYPQVDSYSSVKDNKILFFFPGREADTIKMVTKDQNSCMLNEPKISLFVLEKK